MAGLAQRSPPVVAPSGFGVGTGVGLVVANMVGAGVFLSMGFMAGTMGPGAILAAWAVGAVFALLGTQAYGALAADCGRSGGEYQYLSRYLHPAVGWLAGWGSLLLGFSAPIAVDALAVGAYTQAIVPWSVDPRVVATLVVVALTVAHGVNLHVSRGAQDSLLALKAVLLLGFLAAGLAWGARAWPAWQPAEAAGAGFPWASLVDNQYWIAFAFSGWNAAVYVAGEFREPRRDVARAMGWGCLAVGVLYLLLNFVFVANLTPAEIGNPFDLGPGKAMLGHVLAVKLLGPAAGTGMSLVTLLVFLSATSAMVLTGPRVVSSMAQDGALPGVFRQQDGQPPRAAAWLQAGVALVLVWTQTLREAVQSTAVVLLLFTGLVALSAARLPSATMPARAAGAVYAAFAAFLLYKGIAMAPHVAWILAGAAVALVARLLLTRSSR